MKGQVILNELDDEKQMEVKRKKKRKVFLKERNRYQNFTERKKERNMKPV